LAKSSVRKVARVQTGVRIERRILKILKSVAAFNEISLSSLLEGIFLHSFEG
jgi:predicted DNA-binding ribbon-helix-helix protein